MSEQGRCGISILLLPTECYIVFGDVSLNIFIAYNIHAGDWATSYYNIT